MTKENVLKNLGKKCSVSYPEDEDWFVYEGIISGFTRSGEAIIGLKEQQHGEGWKCPSSLATIRHPMNYYIYAYDCDAVIELKEE